MAQNNVIIGIHAVHEALKDSLTLDQILIKKMPIMRLFVK